MFKIEKGITRPPGEPGVRKYPFSQMEIGDSFLIPQDYMTRVRAAAHRHGERTRTKFTIRRMEDGSYRCWRTA